MLPKFPVNVGFNPENCNDANVRELWSIPAGRILMLLWRPCHLCGPSWAAMSVFIARRIENQRPTDAAGILRAIQVHATAYDEYSPSDSKSFAEEAIDYFSGKLSVPYVGVVQGTAQMQETPRP